MLSEVFILVSMRHILWILLHKRNPTLCWVRFVYLFLWGIFYVFRSVYLFLWGIFYGFRSVYLFLWDIFYVFRSVYLFLWDIFYVFRSVYLFLWYIFYVYRSVYLFLWDILHRLPLGDILYFFRIQFIFYPEKPLAFISGYLVSGQYSVVSGLLVTSND